jgi:hypothetical protein
MTGDGTPDPGGEAIKTADSSPEVRTLGFASGWTDRIATRGAAAGACAAEKLATFAITIPCVHGRAGLFLLGSVCWRWQGGTLWLPASLGRVRSHALTVHQAAHCSPLKTRAIATTIIGFPVIMGFNQRIHLEHSIPFTTVLAWYTGGSTAPR